VGSLPFVISFVISLVRDISYLGRPGWTAKGSLQCAAIARTADSGRELGNASRDVLCRGAETVFRFGACALEFVEDTITQERGSVRLGNLLLFLYSFFCSTYLLNIRWH